jgi:hypothetical protein
MDERQAEAVVTGGYGGKEIKSRSGFGWWQSRFNGLFGARNGFWKRAYSGNHASYRLSVIFPAWKGGGGGWAEDLRMLKTGKN